MSAPQLRRRPKWWPTAWACVREARRLSPPFATLRNDASREPICYPQRMVPLGSSNQRHFPQASAPRRNPTIHAPGHYVSVRKEKGDRHGRGDLQGAQPSNGPNRLEGEGGGHPGFPSCRRATEGNVASPAAPKRSRRRRSCGQCRTRGSDRCRVAPRLLPRTPEQAMINASPFSWLAPCRHLAPKRPEGQGFRADITSGRSLRRAFPVGPRRCEMPSFPPTRR